MTSHSARRFGLAVHSAIALALLAPTGCGSDPPGPPAQQHGDVDLDLAESWVQPQRWTGFWTVLADVREFVGEERWAALDTAWMEKRARDDLASVTADDDYGDVFLLSGLWRLGMLREDVLAAFAQREPEAAWPLVVGDRGRSVGWRPRLERWLRAQPAETQVAALTAELGRTWSDALDAGDLNVAARVLEADEEWRVHEAVRPELASRTQELLRRAMQEYLRGYAQDWRDGRPPRGVIALLERCGVPEGVDLDAVVSAVEHYYREMADETIPLPHPYDLHVRVMRLRRLRR